MAADSTGYVTPPEDSGGLTLGSGSSGTGAPPNKKAMLIALVAVALAGVYVLSRRKASKSAQGTSAAIPTLIAPSSNQDSVSGNNLATEMGAIAQQGTTLSDAIANVKTSLEARIAALQAAAPTATSPPPPSPNANSSIVLAGAPVGVGIGSDAVGGVVGELDNGNGGATYVTSHGYVYNVGGSQYYGGTNGGQVGGVWGSIISGIKPLLGGGYALINPTGQTYNFGPGTGSGDTTVNQQMIPANENIRPVGA